MKVRIATWNMAYWQNRKLLDAAWDCYLREVKADIFLFQEGRPSAAMTDQQTHLVWNEIGGKRDWGSGIYSERYEIREEVIATPFKDVFSIGNATIEDERITLISLYGLMESSGPTKGYSIPNLHRVLSDLTGLLDGRIGGKRKIIMGGDLNASTQFDPMQGNSSHRLLFERIADFGLVDIYGAFGNTDHVQTLRYARSKQPWQNDYIFVSKALVPRLGKYEIVDTPAIRKFSDHNPVVLEVEI